MARIQGTADLHMHTTYSDGRPALRALLDHVALRTTLQVIAITDHDTIEGALEAQSLAHSYPFEVVVGEEVTSRQGHILALYIAQCVPPGLSARETIAAIHEQHGLAVAAHPFISTNPVGKQEVTMQGVGKLFSTLPFDAVEVDNSTPFLEIANFKARRYNRATCRLPELGNSDAHITEAIGKSFTRFPGATAADLRQAIVQRRTSAHCRRYRVPELMSYLGFYLQSTRGSASRTAGPMEAGVATR